MKVQCPCCREIVELVQFETSDAGLRFRCSACREETFLPNPQGRPAPVPAAGAATERPAPAAQAADRSEVVCPKCGNAQQDAYACHRCGLVFARFDPAAQAPDPPAAAALWDQIQRRPEDQALHEDFQRAALAADRVDYAARQYRRWSRDPSRKELAERMLARLVSTAQAKLVPAVQAPRTGNRQPVSKVILWVVLVAALGGVIYYLISISSLLGKIR